MSRDLIGVEIDKAILYLKENNIEYEIVSNDVDKEFPYDKTLVVKDEVIGNKHKIYTNKFLFNIK